MGGLPRFARGLLVAVAAAAAIVACGSRTRLLVTDEPTTDATPDRQADAALAEEDALPPIDVQQDMAKPPPVGCVHQGETQIYLITTDNQLLAFFPPTLTFTTIGHIHCPVSNGVPFSMAVSRSGTAYSVFSDGRFFRISTANAACQATPYAVGQQGYSAFGMGYAGDQLGEALYVSDNAWGKGLATIDTTTLTLSFIGPFVPALPKRCEMTGTSHGELFAYCMSAHGSGSPVVAQIDRASGKVIASTPVNVGAESAAFAFAYWGGAFYMFTSPGDVTTVTRYDPVLKTETAVASHPSLVAGAGVSTCAPN